MMNSTFENLSNVERGIRFGLSLAASVLMMATGFAGTNISGVAFLVSIALATTAILGWDPLKSVSLNMKSLFKGSGISHSEKHA